MVSREDTPVTIRVATISKDGLRVFGAASSILAVDPLGVAELR
jgi:hypothetical protein